MDKIKCVVSEGGYIIPIHAISVINSSKYTHCVWVDTNNSGYTLSEREYNALLEELEFIGSKLKTL